jgi:hypothetical protein
MVCMSMSQPSKHFKVEKDASPLATLDGEAIW